MKDYTFSLSCLRDLIFKDYIKLIEEFGVNNKLDIKELIKKYEKYGNYTAIGAIHKTDSNEIIIMFPNRRDNLNFNDLNIEVVIDIYESFYFAIYAEMFNLKLSKFPSGDIDKWESAKKLFKKNVGLSKTFDLMNDDPEISEDINFFEMFSNPMNRRRHTDPEDIDEEDYEEDISVTISIIKNKDNEVCLQRHDSFFDEKVEVPIDCLSPLQMLHYYDILR